MNKAREIALRILRKRQRNFENAAWKARKAGNRVLYHAFCASAHQVACQMRIRSQYSGD